MISEFNTTKENILQKCRNPPLGLKEEWVKERIKEMLDLLGAWWFMPQNIGLGISGVPDFVGCLKGCLFAIEAKRSYKGVFSWAQEEQLKLIGKACGAAFVVDETGLEKLFRALEEIVDEHSYRMYNDIFPIFQDFRKEKTP